MAQAKPGRSNGLFIALLIALVTTLMAGGVAATLPTTTVSTPSAPPPTPNQIAAAPTPQLPTSQPPTSQPTPSAVPTPTPTAAPTPQPTNFPTPQATNLPISQSTNSIIGYSVEGRPLTAYRIGQGPIKVALVGDIHGGYEANTYTLTLQLVDYFQAHPAEVPPQVSLWIIPTMNPDGLAPALRSTASEAVSGVEGTGHRWNAHDVDLNRNADTDLDGCAGNDWSPDTVGHEGPHPGAGGAYPFSEPEARAVRDFLGDAWIAVFYHSAAEAIYLDSCQRHAPTARLAQVLSEATGYPVPAEGWTGYPVTGDFGDYMAGEGVAAVTLELTDHDDPEFERNLAGVRAILANVSEIVSEEVSESGAEYVWLDDSNTGVWRYAGNTFIHPIALRVASPLQGKVLDDSAYLLDGGRVLLQNLERPDPPTVLLAPGDVVENVRVLEPLDLAAAGDSLLALDRAGDVYRYDPATGVWSLERYDRPPGSTSSHYFVALASDGKSHYLLETTHEQVWRFADSHKGAAWIKLPQSRDVDLSANGGDVYVLTRAMNSPRGSLLRYRDGKQMAGFAPGVDLTHPRQVVATDSAVYVLDRAGRRLLKLDPVSGSLLALYQFPDRRAVSAVAVSEEGRLLLAGRDALYFYGEPDWAAEISGGPVLTGPQPHDPALLHSLRGYSAPIEGARVTKRDFQMPGAPRHYRLGVHEGLDWYSHTVGVTVNRNTPVRAVADGVVIRALVDYQPLTAAQADEWYNRCLNKGYTPPEVLDGYRGRQVWIEHNIIAGGSVIADDSIIADGGGSVISRYAHLSSIEPGIVKGAVVKRGQVIGQVGNSGTPASLGSRTVEVHLHLELWVGGHFVGQFLRPIEAREWLSKILR